MRRWPPAVVRLVLVALALGIGGLAPLGAHAQSGALFLLVPFGAQAVGRGEAVTADRSMGTEGIWWNPAALARLEKREAAVHHGQSVIATTDMLAMAVPSRVLGTLAAGAYLVNYGDQQATDPVNGAPIGVITNRNYLVALSYATPAGKRLNAGLTYKFLMLRFACSGLCGQVPAISGSTSALDAGIQYLLPTARPITLGAAVRNLGPALQLKDAEQADPLPRVVQLGGAGELPLAALTAAGASLEVSGDLQLAEALGGTALGVGAVLGYRKELFLRAGYKLQDGDARGPSFGIGYRRGGFAVDFARRLGGLSAQLGEPPTFVSLRARF
jgi:hypothetical protein